MAGCIMSPDPAGMPIISGAPLISSLAQEVSSPFLFPFATGGRGEREATSGPPPGRVAVPFCLRWPSWPRMRGNERAFARGCSVGTYRSRFGLPGCACRVETAWPWWNKVLRSSLYLTIARSGAGDRIVRFEFAGFGDLVGAPDLAVSCTGVLCRLLCAVAHSRRMARWWLVAWRRGWCSVLACQQWVLVLDQRSLGCVPGRGTSLLRLCCGSFQSLCAMELLLVSVFSASVTCSGGHDVGGRQRWRQTVCLGSTKDLQGLSVIFLCCGVFCVRCYGQLSFCVSLEGACMGHVLYSFIMV
jgi:hypothetical protein